MTTDDLILYYKSLLIAQYVTKSKALATVGAVVTEVIADQVSLTVKDSFNLDTAEGNQLDAIGTYRGLIRFVYGLILTKEFFMLHSYVDSNPTTWRGFATYGQSDSDIVYFFIRYQDITAVTYRMTDSEFRSVIKFRAAIQSSYLSVADIDNILFQFFGVYSTMTDNGDMTITFNDSPSNPSQIFNLVNQSKSLPKPAGVSYTVTNI